MQPTDWGTGRKDPRRTRLTPGPSESRQSLDPRTCRCVYRAEIVTSLRPPVRISGIAATRDGNRRAVRVLIEQHPVSALPLRPEHLRRQGFISSPLSQGIACRSFCANEIMTQDDVDHT